MTIEDEIRCPNKMRSREGEYMWVCMDCGNTERFYCNVTEYGVCTYDQDTGDYDDFDRHDSDIDDPNQCWECDSDNLQLIRVTEEQLNEIKRRINMEGR